nr:hypothetical protein [uncultured Halomonas sp.]
MEGLDHRWLYVIILVLIWLQIILWTYISYSKLEKIENYLENCKLVENNRRIWGGGPLGRMYRLAQISGMLFFPKIIAKNGEADLEEIRNLPISLRRWAIIPACTGATLFAAMIALYIYGKYWLN